MEIIDDSVSLVSFVSVERNCCFLQSDITVRNVIFLFVGGGCRKLYSLLKTLVQIGIKDGYVSD